MDVLLPGVVLHDKLKGQFALPSSVLCVFSNEEMPAAVSGTVDIVVDLEDISGAVAQLQTVVPPNYSGHVPQPLSHDYVVHTEHRALVLEGAFVAADLSPEFFDVYAERTQVLRESILRLQESGLSRVEPTRGIGTSSLSSAQQLWRRIAEKVDFQIESSDLYKVPTAAEICTLDVFQWVMQARMATKMAKQEPQEELQPPTATDTTTTTATVTTSVPLRSADGQHPLRPPPKQELTFAEDDEDEWLDITNDHSASPWINPSPILLTSNNSAGGNFGVTSMDTRLLPPPHRASELSGPPKPVMQHQTRPEPVYSVLDSEFKGFLPRIREPESNNNNHLNFQELDKITEENKTPRLNGFDSPAIISPQPSTGMAYWGNMHTPYRDVKPVGYINAHSPSQL